MDWWTGAKQASHLVELLLGVCCGLRAFTAGKESGNSLTLHQYSNMNCPLKTGGNV